ncbi:MAG: PAS domain-containing protein [Myxococcota bacterium]
MKLKDEVRALQDRVAGLEEERDALEQELETYAEMADQLRVVLGVTSNPVLVLDHERRILYANPAAGALSVAGTEEALLGRRIVELIPPQEQPEVDGRVQQIEGGTKLLRVTQRTIVRLDGKVLQLEVVIGRIRFEGKPAIVVVARDVTERKALEVKLGESEAKAREQLAELEHVYDVTPVGLAFTDKDLRYVRINQRLAELTGRTAAETLGRRIREAVPEVADAVEPLHARLLETGRPLLNQEIASVSPTHPEGGYFVLSYHPVLDPEGELRGVSVVVQDITELRRAEAALKDEVIARKAAYERAPRTPVSPDPCRASHGGD